MSSKRRGSKNEDKGGPNWLTSATDLMTNMMSVFALLFSFAMIASQVASNSTASADSSGSAAQQDAIAIVEGSAGKNTVSDGATFDAPPGEDQTKPSHDQDQTGRFVDALQQRIDELHLTDQLLVAELDDDGTVLLRINDSALFNSAKADINEKADTLLASIAQTLVDYTDIISMIRIEGHTDNRPISNQYFESNWELSTMRAVNVLKRLQELSQLDAGQFSAVGYGEFHPIADNNTEKGRAQNRRVDFIIETDTVAEKAYNYFNPTTTTTTPAAAS